MCADPQRRLDRGAIHGSAPRFATMDTPLLWHIPLSHFSEKVRWAIDYKRFNDPKRNRFFAAPPEIEHKVG